MPWYYWVSFSLAVASLSGVVGIAIWAIIISIPWKSIWRRMKWLICRIFGHRDPWANWFDDRLEEPAFVGCNFCGFHNVPGSGRG